MKNLKATLLRRYFAVAIFKLLVFAPFNLFGQLTAVTTTVSGACGGYWVYLPSTYAANPTKNYPVIFFFHGIGELGSGSASDLQKLLIYGPTKLINTGQWPTYFTVGGQNFQFIVIAPQFSYWPYPSDVDSVINMARAKYRVDPTRMYITGLSMGGGVTWSYVWASSANASKIAAIVPIAGADNPTTQKAAVIAGANLPVWALQNLNDPTVPSSYSIDYVNYINSNIPAPNPLALLTIFQASGHDSWDSAYNLNYKLHGLNVFQWMLQYTRGGSSSPPPIPPALPNPVANAGDDTSVTLPDDSLFLSGTASQTNGNPITSYSWSEVSGPGALIKSPGSVTTEVSGLSQGSYVFSFTLKDSLGFTTSDTVSITVDAAAAPPPAPDPPSSGQTANNYIAAYNGLFMYGINPDFYGNQWTDELLGTIAKSAGIGSERVSLPDIFVAQWGYNIRLSTFAYYQSPLGFKDNTVFLNQPRTAWRDPTTYPGSTQQSLTFANLYDSVWNADGSLDSNNYYANYVYNIVSRYGGQVKFWEVWNEPDVNNTETVYYQPGQPGNWYDNPPPVGNLYGFYAPVFSYIRMLRITYEIVHKLYPNEYVCTGGIGYPSFLDAILRYTDNPNGGQVTPQYPLKGGAYFDVLSYHCYPEYSLQYWSNAINGFVYTRTSDYAAQAIINLKDSFQVILKKYGYDGSIYPQKPYILTETNIARKAFSNYIGSDQAQLNFSIKALVQAQKNNVRQLYFYMLGETSDYSSATNEYQLMGLYQNLTTASYGSQQMTQEGEAVKTTSMILSGYSYDSARTRQLNLPASMDGAALSLGGKYIYVLWAKCLVDESESASASYSFPSAMGVGTLMKYGWDFSVNSGDTQTVSSLNIPLTGTPVFLSQSSSLVNQGPVANAGPTQTIVLPTNSVQLNASGSSDQSGTIISYTWAQISGPTNFNIVKPGAEQTQVTSLTLGNYIFSLTVVDNNGDSSTADVEINVNNSGAPSNPPVSEAGTNITLTLPVSSCSVNGSASYSPEGKIVTYDWQEVSGPATASITSPDSAKTTITNLVKPGVYKFTLTVTDNLGATSTSTLTITVNPPTNQSPVANAGNNIQITLPLDSVSLNGTASTDPGGSISAYSWSQKSGPSTANIETSSDPVSTVNSLVAGKYVFTLTVSDSYGDTSSALVTVTVLPAPVIHPPVANAGDDTTLVLPADSLVVSGVGSTDAGGTITGYTWTEISGPAAILVQPDSETTWIKGLVTGEYALRLTITDSQGLTSSDSLLVIVNPAADIPPVANAGNNITITLPLDSAVLNGSGSADSSGRIASYLWTQRSGPSAAQILNPDSTITGVDSLVQGVYKFQLKVTDTAGASSVSQVTVTVNAAPHQAPVANAGGNLNITLPLDSASLNGSGSYSPDGSIVSYIWKQLSGPSTGQLESADSSITEVNGLVAGNYLFQLAVTDNDGSVSSAQVQVTVNPAAHTPPMANAGSNITLTLPADSTQLDGTGSSDSDGVITSYAWTKISGPAAYNLSSPDSAKTMITGLNTGVYVFSLTVTDNFGYSSSAQVTVTVNPPPPGMIIANAGSNITITLPLDSATLNGTGSEDYAGTITSYSWTKIGGPAIYTLTNSGNAIAKLNNLEVGTYEFQLTIKDNYGMSSSSTVQVTVIKEQNSPPVANAGNNISMTLPANSATLNGGGSTDPDGTIVGYSWSNLSGPYGYSLTGANSPEANLTNLSAGVYEFELTVTDNNGLTSSATVTVTVNPADISPPVASAGTNITLTLPVDSTTLNGSASYDTDGTITGYQWTEASGPATYALTGASSAQASLTGLGVGTYVLRLTVTNNQGASSSSEVTVTVNQLQHIPPVAVPGNDTTINLPNSSLVLDGSGSYDTDGQITGYNWTFLSGPATYSITGSGTSQATITNLQEGVYVFALQVTDNMGAIGTAQVTITVNDQAHVPPVAVVGPAIQITLPLDSTTLNGSGSYDTDGTITSYTWTEVSGPSAYTIVGANEAISELTGLVAGTYVFALKVTDNYDSSSTAEVTVTVSPQPDIPPVANAGTDTTITLPSDTVFLNGMASYAVIGKITSYQWKEVAGPTQYQISDSNSAFTMATGLVAGNYLFTLTVTGSNGMQSTSEVQVTVNLNPNVINGQVVIFPNPVVTQAEVYFYNNQAGQIVINVYDMWGRLQRSYNYIKQHQAVFKETIDMTTLPAGVYFVQVGINSSFSTAVKVEKLQN